jgi:23S rRNA (cytosine1962-C5)-methyltransferase
LPNPRPIETETTVPVSLRKPLEARLRAGHPWIFRDALAPRAGNLPEGTVVLVRGRDRRPIARGFWDAQSPIAVRVVTTVAGPTLEQLVRERLADRLTGRLNGLAGTNTNAFRWVHGEADALPGVHIDVYDQVAAVRFDGNGARAFYMALGAQGLPALLLAAGAQAGMKTVIDRGDRSLLGGEPAAIDEVRENGLRFAVDLVHGQKGGLFLDQRENREEVRRRARGQRVLNLFGYTGGFSVYAAAGGARATDTVDVAAPAIAAARGNFALNDLTIAAAGFHAQDAFAFLTRARAAGMMWDVVISDPPSFAPRKTALPAARVAYRRLHSLAAAVTTPGGLLCAASCSSHFPREEFLSSVSEGVTMAGRRFALEQMRGAGFDHPVVSTFPEGDYLKFAMGRVMAR